MAAPAPPVGRYRTTLSCAECRRLKLRCDRVFPCSSCQRRDCASICPNGFLSPKSLRKDGPSQLAKLRARVHELESELDKLQTKSPSFPPHLPDEKPEDRVPSVDSSNQPTDGAEDLIERFGTLSITGYGKSKYFGTTGSTSHLLWMSEEGASKDDTPISSTEVDDFPPEILFLITAFPAAGPSHMSSEVWSWISASLPSHMEAWALVETFYENAAYFLTHLPRKMFIEQIFSFFYGSNKTPVDIPRAHRLGLLLIVFAVGQLVDLTKPASPTGGKRFYFLARAALATEKLYESPTLTAIQALLIMRSYLDMSDHKGSGELGWVLSGITIRLAIMLGLHREPEKFQPTDSESFRSHIPNPVEAVLRRDIFNEVVHSEIWQSLRFGRPSMVHFDQYDSKPPGDGPESDNVFERSHAKGQAWSYQFVRECLVQVLDFTASVKPIKYSDILKLDAKLRAYPRHTHIDMQKESTEWSNTESRALVILHFAAFSIKEIALLYLHRSCFASAMVDFTDPFSCPFTPSVYVSYRSSNTIVDSIAKLYEREPALSARIPIFWKQLFMSCVLGALVVQCPTSSLAISALAHLDTACELFSQAQGVPPTAVLPKVLLLQRKAHFAFQLYTSGQTKMPKGIDVSDELSLIGGSYRAHFGSSKASSPPAEAIQTQASPASSPHNSRTLSQPGLPANDTSSGMSVEIPKHDQGNWESLTQEGQIGSVPLGIFPDGAFDFSDTLLQHADDTALLTDVFSDETHPAFLTGPVPGQVAGHSFVDMDPTWKGFMVRMGLD